MKVLAFRSATRFAWIVSVVMVVAVGSQAWAGESWTQWGGPNQDFKAASTGLASSWPEEGPKKIWERELGDGYSAILVENGRLYTMYRDGEEEVAVCLEAGSGETIWEQRYTHKPAQGHVSQFGDGPRSTPLISGNQIFTIGVAGLMHALDKKTGKVQWSHELWGEEFGGNELQHGYASSPIDYGDTVIALVGGEDKSIVAFKKKDGKVAWKSESFKNSYATPKIMKVAGEDQLVTFMAAELVGLDPKTGKLNWSYSFGNQFGQNISPPVMSDSGILFLSSTQAGSRGLKISKDGEVEEVWSTRKIQFYHVSSVKIGDYVYGSTGSMAPAFMSAINIETGEIPWRARGFSKANVIYADGKLYILDEDGNFYMANATPEKLEVISKIELLDKVAWTVPTIVGKTMFVRDKTKIMAVDLG